MLRKMEAAYVKMKIKMKMDGYLNIDNPFHFNERK